MIRKTLPLILTMFLVSCGLGGETDKKTDDFDQEARVALFEEAIASPEIEDGSCDLLLTEISILDELDVSDSEAVDEWVIDYGTNRGVPNVVREDIQPWFELLQDLRNNEVEDFCCVETFNASVDMLWEDVNGRCNGDEEESEDGEEQ